MERTFLVVIAGFALAAAAPPDVAVLRWMSPDSSRPGSCREWRLAAGREEGWRCRPLAGHGAGFDDRVDVLVDDTLAAPLAPRIDTLVADLARAGFDAFAFSVAGSSAESLRAFLASEHDSGLVAAFLVGDLPVPWFQLIDDWNGNGVRDPDEGYEEFPCDLFLMDLDGSWLDTLVRLDSLDSLVPGTDGIYDVHSGDLVPEIAVGRLPASLFPRADTLLPAYLDRSHRYRAGELPVLDRALVYIDDDWADGAPDWDQDVGLLYEQRASFWERESTRAADYRPRIDSAAFQWVQLCAHSWPGGHCFYYDYRQQVDWYYVEEIPPADPEACFYNLFACSNARYTEYPFCAGSYTLLTRHGLGAIGSTKTGSMLEFGDYYRPMSEGRTVGLAFRDWFAARLDDTLETWEQAWYYGMCHIGDPMLEAAFTSRDAAVRTIVEPAYGDTVQLGDTVLPRALVANNGIDSADIRVFLAIGSGYADSAEVTLAPSAADTVAFRAWVADTAGWTAVGCCASLEQDQRPWNDVAGFEVYVQGPPGVAEQPVTPVRPSVRPLATPARGIARLEVALPAAGPVTLRLADRAGRICRGLFAGNMAAGTSRLALDLSGLAPGVYFLLLDTPAARASCPLTVLR